MQLDRLQNRAPQGRRHARWLITLAIWIVALGLARQAIASVSLLYFRGTVGDSLVYLTWATGNELTLAGFNLWRRDVAVTPLPGTPPGDKLNQYLIQAQYSGQVIGATYLFTDTTAVNGTPYWYRLEWVDTQDPESSYFENENNPLVPGNTPTPTPTTTPSPTVMPTLTSAPILPTAPPEVTATLEPTQPPGEASSTPVSPPPDSPTPLPTATPPGPTGPPGATSTLLPATALPATAMPLATTTVPSARTATASLTSSPPATEALAQQNPPTVPPKVTFVVTRGLPLGSATFAPPRGVAPSTVATPTGTALAVAELPPSSNRQGMEPNGVDKPGGPEGRRTGLILVAGAVLGLVGLGGLGYVFWRWSRPAPAATAAPDDLGAASPTEPAPTDTESHDWRRPLTPD